MMHGPQRRYTWRRAQWLVLAGSVIVLLLAAVAVGPRLYALWRTQDRIYAPDEVPPRRVAIVFGARVFSSGRLSPMLADRVRTGAELYAAGKVDALLLTGDNSQAHYNEPEAMRRYARSLGVPDDALVLDYAGFRTYDSCYRARAIFEVDDAILVTQDFHLPRALLICNELGIDAVGVVADVGPTYRDPTRSIIYSHLREFPASTLAVLDLLRRPKPVLGEPLPIFEDQHRQARDRSSP